MFISLYVFKLLLVFYFVVLNYKMYIIEALFYVTTKKGFLKTSVKRKSVKIKELFMYL